MPEIDILIKKSSTGQGQAPQTPEADREPGKQSLQNQAVNTALINAGKQILMQGINQYAELTGNYAGVESINAALSIGADIAMVATGPVGAIAVASRYLINAASSFTAQARARNNLDLARERAGFVSTQASRYSQ